MISCNKIIFNNDNLINLVTPGFIKKSVGFMKLNANEIITQSEKIVKLCQT